jgi:hypothetical protein
MARAASVVRAFGLKIKADAEVQVELRERWNAFDRRMQRLVNTRPARVPVMLAWVLGVPMIYVVGIDRLVKASEAVVHWSAHSYLHQIAGCASLVAAAVVLYFFRKFRRARYGLLEMVFGVTVMWFVLGGPPASANVTFVTLLGAGYVFVRGADNFEQAMKANFGDNWLSLFLDVFRPDKLPDARSDRNAAAPGSPDSPVGDE